MGIALRSLIFFALLMPVIALCGTKSLAQQAGPRIPGMPDNTTVGVKPDTVSGGGINQRGQGNATPDSGSAAGASLPAVGGPASAHGSFDAHDLDGDGLVSRGEAAGHAELVRRFDLHDANRDGRLTRSEFAEELPKPPVRKQRKSAPRRPAATG